MYPIRTMARVLKVSTSGYYAWRSRPASSRATADAHPCRAAGRRRSHRSQARRPADALGRNHRRQPAQKRASHDAAGARSSPDKRSRAPQFRRRGAERVVVADITFIPTLVGFLYLAVVLDAWSRRIVGWAFSADLKTRVVLDALDMALAARRPDNVIHHSDRGSQYTSVAFGNRCKEAGVRPSTGSVGDAYDNAMCESFFATLECELIDRHRFRSHTEARTAVFQFIEGFYNPSRRHSALGHLSPIEYERRRDGLIKPS